MDPQKVFLVLVDISGYTRFIRFHKISLLHAERIIDELLESVIAEARVPLVLQELQGDAIYFYALSDGTRETARNVCAQIARGIEAFRRREAELISECTLCACEACRMVGQLTLKAVIHHGEVVFTRVRQFTKLSGEDVILAHRLLKNSIARREYMLLTEEMHALVGDLDDRTPEARTEDCTDLGPVKVRVYYPSETAVLPQQVSLLARLKMSMKMARHALKRLFAPAARRYANLELSQQMEIDGQRRVAAASPRPAGSARR